MKGIIKKINSYDEMSKRVALHVKRFIGNPQLGILGLPTGGTPIGMYKELREDKKLDWSKVVTFNLDEYAGIDKDHPESYKNYMYRNLFSHIDIDEDKVHFPNVEHYDSRIAYFGGLDFTVLGIGNNGHIAFNEPGSSFESKTRLVDLDERTISDNSRFFNSIDEVPKQAWTMGLKTIMDSSEIFLIAQGKSKWEIIREALLGEITESIPASILQEHKNLKVLYCD
jgi:glucosamine-6-phosphate deaminase